MTWYTQELEARRKEAVQALKSGSTQLEVMDLYHVSRVTVWRWVCRDREGKLEAQPRPRKGCRLSRSQLSRLAKEYGKGPGRYGEKHWSYPLVVRLIKDMFGISYHRTQVGRILRKLGLVEVRQYRRMW